VIEKPFPKYIAPAPKEDPFVEIREMSYEFAPGRFADLHFDGDVFETEDQRNWSDGSYKTFCTPLRLPFPVEVTAGTKIEQHVRLHLRGGIEGVHVQSETGAKPVEIEIDAVTRGPLPSIGIGATPQRLAPKQLDRLKTLRAAHLRVDLHLPDSTARQALELAAEQAVTIGSELECVLYCSLNAAVELKTLLSWLKTSDPIGRWLIFDDESKTTPPHLIELASEILGPVVPGIAIGGGSNAYFTELNRDRPDLGNADLVCYSLNPQVHAFDNTSLVENALAIAATVESARHLYPDKPIAVTPITLKPRFNPDATGAGADERPDCLPDNVDPRQMSLFGAAWTLAAIQSLAGRGASSATFYETLGWRGVMERDEGSHLPAQFRSRAGGVFPLYIVLAALGAFQGGEVLSLRVSQPLAVAALAIEKSGRRRVLLANLTPNPQAVALSGLKSEFRLRRLDENSVDRTAQAPEELLTHRDDAVSLKDGRLPLSLLPYAIAILDS
jgi:D-apionolactonase